METTDDFSCTKLGVIPKDIHRVNNVRTHAYDLLGFYLVQSLNSPFFPPHIEAQPGRAKELSERRVQDNLHAHAQNDAIFFPQIGGKTIFGSTFQIWPQGAHTLAE